MAEARAAARGLGSIRFVTGDLLSAPELGRFDYIDCCGVLHHLPDPDAGFAALAEALAPGGGIGLMVYAPYGRTGVYPLQAAFGRLLRDDPPAEQVRLARAALARHVAANGGLSVSLDGLSHSVELPRAAAPVIAAIGGRNLGQIAQAARLDWVAFGAAWGPVHRALTGFNLLHYSEGARR